MSMVHLAYTFLEHITDAYIEAYGSSLEKAYANAALALTATMIDVKRVLPRFSREFKVDGKDKFNLLYNWLEALLISLNVESNIFSKFHVKICEGKVWELVATAYGEQLDPARHHYKVEVKAVTYHMMEVIRIRRNEYVVRFLLDL
jgi:SHS2 domain-containing protein